MGRTALIMALNACLVVLLSGCTSPDSGSLAPSNGPFGFRFTTTYDDTLRRDPYTGEAHEATRLPGGATASGQHLSLQVAAVIGSNVDDWESDDPCTGGWVDESTGDETPLDCRDLADRDVIRLPAPSDDVITYPLGTDGIIHFSVPTGVRLWIYPSEPYSEKMREVMADPDGCAAPFTPMAMRAAFTTVGDLADEGDNHLAVTGQGNAALRYFGYCDESAT